MIKFNPFQVREREREREKSILSLFDYFSVFRFASYWWCFIPLIFSFLLLRKLFTLRSSVGYVDLLCITVSKMSSTSSSIRSRSSHIEHNRIVLFIRCHYIFHNIMYETMNENIKETREINRAQCVEEKELP